MTPVFKWIPLSIQDTSQRIDAGFACPSGLSFGKVTDTLFYYGFPSMNPDKDTSTKPIWHQTTTAAYIGPFVAFLATLIIIQQIGSDDPSAAWWLKYPEHWGYPLQAILCISLVVFWRKHYPRFSLAGSGLAVLMGMVGITIWLLPPWIHSQTGFGENGPIPWLKWLGFRTRLDGFDPYQFGNDTPPLLFGAILFFRFLRLVIAVSLVEEIFWRGFLMPLLSDPDGDWKSRPINQSTTKALLLTSLAFGLAHLGPDLAVALVYGTLTGWVTLKTGNLWAAVLMHAVSNLCLGLFILGTHWWGLW